MKAINLTEEERGLFVGHFYDAWDVGPDDMAGNPTPWGCPWLYDEDVVLNGDTLQEMAENYFKSVRGHVADAIELSKK